MSLLLCDDLLRYWFCQGVWWLGDFFWCLVAWRLFLETAPVAWWLLLGFVVHSAFIDERGALAIFIGWSGMLEVWLCLVWNWLMITVNVAFINEYSVNWPHVVDVIVFIIMPVQQLVVHWLGRYDLNWWKVVLDRERDSIKITETGLGMLTPTVAIQNFCRRVRTMTSTSVSTSTDSLLPHLNLVLIASPPAVSFNCY